MSKLLDELNKYKESCLDDDGYVLHGKAEDLVFQSAELLQRYEEAFQKIVKHNELIGSKTINKIAEEILKFGE